MNDNTHSDLRTQDDLSHTENISRCSREDMAVENEDEIQGAESSDTNQQSGNPPEDGPREIANHPQQGSFLSRPIQARPDLLQHEPPQDNLVLQNDTNLNPDPLYLSSHPRYLSKNPNEHYPDVTRPDEFVMGRNSHGKREQTYNPPLDQSDRQIPKRPERESHAFTPTVRRCKSKYQQEQQGIATLAASRSEKQRSKDDGVVPESSAQGAQRELASTSADSDSSHSSNINAENVTAIVSSREGMAAEKRSYTATNPHIRGSSTEAVWDFNGDREQHQSDSSSDSDSRAVERPLATPRPQYQRVFSDITRDDRSSEIMLPRWQLDSEVDECPICHKYFNFFSRKHHCRKCGRVVCNACSPHRITIPYQYIVQPPIGFDYIAPDHARTRSRTTSQNSAHDMETGGGMKVRLCNPCVPDPNISPPAPISTLDRPLPPLPQSSGPSSQPPDMATSHRERVRRSELCPICGDRLPPSTTAIENHIDRCITRHLREVDFSTQTPRERPQASYPSEQSPSSSSLPLSSNAISHSTRPRHTSEATALGNLGVGFNNFPEQERNHSVSAAAEVAPSRPFLSSRMICYAATQLDTIGEDSECIICMEDFEEDVEMARLECLCKYHKKCIDGWFYKHPGKCPVHGQDNY